MASITLHELCDMMTPPTEVVLARAIEGWAWLAGVGGGDGGHNNNDGASINFLFVLGRAGHRGLSDLQIISR